MLLQDFRYGLRGLWLSKGFATVAILCLGFGIGLNTTIFSIVDGVLLKPFPYTDPDRIVVPVGTNQKAGIGQSGISYPDLKDWREASASFVSLAATQGRSIALADGGGEPARYVGGAISADLFPMLGVAPVAGRGFSARDDMPGAEGTVLLSYEVWSTRYQLDPTAIGRRVLINSSPAIIIGVMPPKFEFPSNQKLWVPLAPLANADSRTQRGNMIFARLKAGVSIEQARSELSGIAARLARQYPDSNQDWGVRIMTLRERFIPPDVTTVIWLMMAGVTLVLLIAGSNVANLLLARASVRQREIALRAALGAGRLRIVRQLLAESVVLSLASLPLGILLAEVGTRLIAADMPPDQVPYYITWSMDGRSLAYSLIVAFLTAIVFGLAPALQATRGNLHHTLKEGTRGNSVRRSLLRSGLVVAQVSLALVALVGALLFVRTFSNLDTYEVGFDVRPLMTMRFYMAGTPYDPPDAKLHRVQDVVNRIEALPGVLAAFGSNFVPLSGGGGGGRVAIEGQPELRGPQAQVTVIAATGHIARVLGLSVRGRDLTEDEGNTHQPVALVSQSMAARFWPNREAIGGRFRLSDTPGDAGGWFTVVGVVPDVKLYGVDPSNDQPDPTAYEPYAYQQALNTGVTLRTAGDPASVTAAARAAIRGSDVNLPVFNVSTVDDLRRLSYWQYGLYGWIFGTIGIVGLLLASVGVYGVLSYSVSQRTQEIGVRMALGADQGVVLRLVMGYGLVLSGIGVVIGLVLAPLGTRMARQLLYHVSPFDPVSFGAVALVLVAVSVIASWVPARRAMRVEPMIALRGE
jgi:putative ABC transport system permease protein